MTGVQTCALPIFRDPVERALELVETQHQGIVEQRKPTHRAPSTSNAANGPLTDQATLCRRPLGHRLASYMGAAEPPIKSVDNQARRRQKARRFGRRASDLVEPSGIEPLTSTMPL